MFDGRKHLGLPSWWKGKDTQIRKTLNINMALEDKVNEILGLEPSKTRLKKKRVSAACT